jgi:hypothetical protein
MFLEHQTFPNIEVKICFLPQNKCMFCCDSLCPLPLQLIYNHGHTIWDKKMNRYREHLNEHIGNLIGTQWEHTKKNKKFPLHPPKRKFIKKKKTTPLESSHCWHESSILKTICHYFHFKIGGTYSHVSLFFNLKTFFLFSFFSLCSFILENHLLYFYF